MEMSEAILRAMESMADSISAAPLAREEADPLDALRSAATLFTKAEEGTYLASKVLPITIVGASDKRTRFIAHTLMTPPVNDETTALARHLTAFVVSDGIVRVGPHGATLEVTERLGLSNGNDVDKLVSSLSTDALRVARAFARLHRGASIVDAAKAAARGVRR